MHAAWFEKSGDIAGMLVVCISIFDSREDVVS